MRSQPTLVRPPQPPVVTESDLHAWLDSELPADRQAAVRDYLDRRPEERQRLEAYRAQKRALHALFDPVLDEPLPQPLLQAAWPRTPWMGWRLVAGACGLSIALASGWAGWSLRGWTVEGTVDDMAAQLPWSSHAPVPSAGGFVQRAAVAHSVYSPDPRRAVELDAAHETQLVTWLTKRMGAPVRVPHLQSQGFELEGGRLLPGGGGPVAQFMYRQADGERLTLYVSNELDDLGTGTTSPAAMGGQVKQGLSVVKASFRFARLGPVNVFYWVDGGFGYALSADLERSQLADVAEAVYQQLASAAAAGAVASAPQPGH
jgi:anti-sigma factor RsiW